MIADLLNTEITDVETLQSVPKGAVLIDDNGDAIQLGDYDEWWGVGSDVPIHAAELLTWNRSLRVIWLPPEVVGYETDATPQPRHGDHGTCAKCGGGIRYHESTDHFGYVFHALWLHDQLIADGHNAVLGGPA